MSLSDVLSSGEPGEAASGEAERLMRYGRARLGEHWLNQAEDLFRQVLALSSDHPEALRLLGVTLSKLGRAEDGVAMIRRALNLAPHDLAARVDLAVALREAGRDEEARNAYAEAMAAADPALRQAALPLSQQCFSVERGQHPFKIVDYPYKAEIRYGGPQPPHPHLLALIQSGRERYRARLDAMSLMQAEFAAIPLTGDYATADPFWLNTWFPPLDAMALWTMLGEFKPQKFVEIGSGMSTKFARRAVTAQRLATKLISLDPEPRNAIDSICDQVIRRPLEACSPTVFESLAAGDILFLDSSHRSFQGSDVTVFFLEILPRLKPGVVVHVHDIYLPEDYPSGHLWRLWNEQYLLAMALMYGGEAFEILFPGWWVGRDRDLARHRDQGLRRGPLEPISLHGASFWMRKR